MPEFEKAPAMLQLEKDNQKIYDENWDSWVDMKRYGPTSRWLRYLLGSALQSVDLSTITSVLDVGCGEGTTTAFLATKFPLARVTGIDFSQTGIACASKNHTAGNLRFIHDVNSDTLCDRFDLVCCFEVLEHVEDWQGLLLRMVTSTSRYLLISFPVGRMRPYEINVGHVRNFRRNEVEAFLTGQGLRPLKTLYAGFPFFSPLYREICNLTNSASNEFSKGAYGFSKRAVSFCLYLLFRLFTLRKYGDQFVGVFQKS